VIASHFNYQRVKTRVTHTLQFIGIALLTFSACWWSVREPFTRDVTDARNHTLSAASMQILNLFEAPISVTAYVPTRSPRRKQIEFLIKRYQRNFPGLELRFVDPADEPEKVRAENIRGGELIVSAAGRSQRTSHYSEQAFTDTLARLTRAADRWIVFVKGHGERSPTGVANHDISDWASTLEQRGLNVQEISLAEFSAIPDNTSVLVIASPQLNYQPSEAQAIEQYLERGGNLLWLAEPDSPANLTGLERTVGFERIPGTIVDPVSVASGIDNPAFVLLNRYADHPSIDEFNYTTIFFYACALHERPSAGWNAKRLIHTGDKAWSETDPLDGNVGYDENSDFLGPLPISLALSRTLGGHEQRVVIVGDGDFLANAYLQNTGNQDLGVRFVEWLAHDDALVAVPSRVARDNNLVLENWHKAVIGFTFLVGLPTAFALNGVVVWWRRRRA
jgi:ABC-type uncharacterized transport system involved in gliding motility auxiliary subunit